VLTAKSQILREITLSDHEDWSLGRSRTPNIYLHYFGNESSLLIVYGIENMSKSDR